MRIVFMGTPDFALYSLKALVESGEEVEITGHELLARCFCHELDHLDGGLYIDKAYSMDDDE